MREIKFRATHKIEQKTYPCFGWMDGQVLIIKDGRAVGENDEYFDLQQFIGVLDKNGKEVYEGDHCVTEHGKGWIVYDGTKAAWIIQGHDYWEYVWQEIDGQSQLVKMEKPE